MKRIGIILAMTLACSSVWGAGDEKTPEVPAAASPAIRKYQAALAAADLERNKAVEKARVALVADLKTAQKHALEGGDVDGATGVAALAKKFAGQRLLRPPMLVQPGTVLVIAFDSTPTGASHIQTHGIAGRGRS